MAELLEYEETEYYTLGNDDFFTSSNLYQAKNGEKGIYNALRTQYRKETCVIGHNTFGSQYEYCCGSGIDLSMIDLLNHPEFIVHIEVKNLTQQNKPYGTDFVIKKVIPRFTDPNATKVLAITYLNLLTKKDFLLLAKERIHVFEIGYVLTPDIYKKENIRELYALGFELHEFIEQIIAQQTAKRPNQQCDLKKFLTDSTTDFFVKGINSDINDKAVSDVDEDIHDTPIHAIDKLDMNNEQLHDENWILREIDKAKRLGLYRDFNS